MSRPANWKLICVACNQPSAGRGLFAPPSAHSTLDGLYWGPLCGGCFQFVDRDKDGVEQFQSVLHPGTTITWDEVYQEVYQINNWQNALVDPDSVVITPQNQNYTHCTRCGFLYPYGGPAICKGCQLWSNIS